MIRTWVILALVSGGCVGEPPREQIPRATTADELVLVGDVLDWTAGPPAEELSWEDAITQLEPTAGAPTPELTVGVAGGSETWVPFVQREGALALTIAPDDGSFAASVPAAGAVGPLGAVVIGGVGVTILCAVNDARCARLAEAFVDFLTFGRHEEMRRSPRGMLLCYGDFGIATSSPSADGLLRIETCWRPPDGGICTHCPADGELKVTPQVLERASGAVGIELVNYGDSPVTLEATSVTPELVAGKLSRSRAAVQLTGTPLNIWIRSHNGLRQAVILRP